MIDGISSETIPLHIRVCFASLGQKPETSPTPTPNETMALPIYPELTYEALRLVVGPVARFFDALTIHPLAE